MTENAIASSHSTTKKTIRKQEKIDYYRAWESSGMNKRNFCKTHGLPIDVLYRWHKLLNKKTPPELKKFSPVIAKTISTNVQHELTQLEMR